jgi:hypothetical protein
MKRPVWLLVGVVVAVLAAWYFLRSGGGESVAVNLVDQFATAKDKRPTPQSFEVVQAKLGDRTLPAIFVKEPGRLIYEVTVPEKGALKFSLGIKEEGWTMQGDGVLFRVLLAAGGPPEEIMNVTLNPFGNPSDRGWRDMTLDLSEYSGEKVDLFFNTNSSGPSRPPRDDRNGDFALWGQPRLVSQ